MRKIKHFFWDFDGTLFDTYPVIIENLQLALRDFGYDCDAAEAMRLMLDTIPAARNHYADRFGISRDALTARYQHYHELSAIELRSEPFDGLPEVLERIRSLGGRNYIFTHRRASETWDYLQKNKLRDHFQDVLGTESEGFTVKPSPDSLLYLMEKYGIDPNESVMVGDRDCDLGSGKNAGMKTAHFVCATFPENLECDWRITSFSEMLTML